MTDLVFLARGAGKAFLVLNDGGEVADGDDDEDDDEVERGRGRVMEIGTIAESGLGTSSGEGAAQSLCTKLSLRVAVMS